MKRLAGIALLALVLAGAEAGTSAAETFKPTRFGDPDPGKCKPNDCSLREAVVAANKRSGPHTIRLEKGTYRLAIPEALADPNDSSAGDLDINSQVSFVGTGAKKSRVSGEGSHRVFDLQGTLNEYKLRDLSVKNGVSTSWGGGILATNLGGGVELRRVILAKNEATNGGGIYFASGNLTIVDSSIQRNIASTYGGGVFLPAAGGLGAADATVRSSTLSTNAASLGGGIALDGFDVGGFPEEPVLEMVNSTVTGNQVTVSGGGISSIQGATADVDRSTIAYNNADSDNQGGGFGGGIYQSTSAVFEITNSVVSRNTVHGVDSEGGATCFGAFTGLAMVDGPTGSGTGCSIVGPDVPDVLVGEIGGHGGPTKTIPLLPGSPAINYGGADCPSSDQRGRPRPAVPAECDFGSFERQNP